MADSYVYVDFLVESGHLSSSIIEQTVSSIRAGLGQAGPHEGLVSVTTADGMDHVSLPSDVAAAEFLFLYGGLGTFPLTGGSCFPTIGVQHQSDPSSAAPVVPPGPPSCDEVSVGLDPAAVDVLQQADGLVDLLAGLGTGLGATYFSALRARDEEDLAEVWVRHRPLERGALPSVLGWLTGVPRGSGLEPHLEAVALDLGAALVRTHEPDPWTVVLLQGSDEPLRLPPGSAPLKFAAARAELVLGAPARGWPVGGEAVVGSDEGIT